MCLVLTLSQSFAISGGPFGRGGPLVLTGTYAGVLTPIAVVVDPGPPPVTLPPDNSLGLFSLGIAPVGLGTGSTPSNAVIGAVVIFRNGIVYVGWADVPAPVNPITPGPATQPPGIIGTVDPTSRRLSAIITGKNSRDQVEVTACGTTSTVGPVTHTDSAVGNVMHAKVVAGEQFGSVARIRGTAEITYTTDAHVPSCIPNACANPQIVCALDPEALSGGAIDYRIRGFRQSF